MKLMASAFPDNYHQICPSTSKPILPPQLSHFTLILIPLLVSGAYKATIIKALDPRAVSVAPSPVGDYNLPWAGLRHPKGWVTFYCS